VSFSVPKVGIAARDRFPAQLKGDLPEINPKGRIGAVNSGTASPVPPVLRNLTTSYLKV